MIPSLVVVASAWIAIDLVRKHHAPIDLYRVAAVYESPRHGVKSHISPSAHGAIRMLASCSIIQPANLQPVVLCCDGNRAACIDITTAELLTGCPEGQICQHHQEGGKTTYACGAPV